MGWSLSYQEPKAPRTVDWALLVAGKSLYLANSFESKCRYVLRVSNLVSYVEAHPAASYPEAIASLSKDKLLGPTIADLRLFPKVHSDDVDALERARDARNFIAHEGAAFGYVFTVEEQHIREHLTKLRMAVSDLADGDNVVSRWVYEIDEKEPAPGILIAHYPKMVDEWVFGQFDYI